MRGRWWLASLATMVVVGGLVTVVALHPGSGGNAHSGQALADTISGSRLGIGAASGTSLPGRSPVTSPAATTSATTAGITATAAAASGSAAAPLAGRIKPGTTYHGVATWYRTNGGGGACLFDNAGPLTAAMNWSDYEGSKACGAYVQVRASNGATVTVRITNECPAPCRVHQLDLSPQAFAKLAAPKTGQISVTWRLLSPQISGGIALRYKVGSSRYWCAIQVINHRNPVARLEVRAGRTWRNLARTGYNYFLSPKGSGCGSSIRVTDIYGQRLVAPALPIKPDVTQRTALQFTRH